MPFLNKLSLLGLIALGAACSDSSADSIDVPDGGALPDSGLQSRADGSAAPAELETLIALDAMEPFLPANATTAHVAGHVIGPGEVTSLTVAGSAVAANGGAFSADTPIHLGVNSLDVIATLRDGRTANALPAVIAADYLPEGVADPRGMLVPLSTELVRSLSAPLAAEIASLDIAAEIASRDVLSSDDRCTTRPASARSDGTAFDLAVNERGELWVELRVPALAIGFTGECRGLVRRIPVHGSIGTDIVIRSQLFAPTSETCATRIEHTPPQVELPGFAMDVEGEGLGGILISVFGGSTADESRETFRAEIAERANMLLDEKLDGVDFFPEATMVSVFGHSIGVKRCVTGITSESGIAYARLGSIVRGTGTREAPGHPFMPGADPAARADAMYLDSQLLGQLMFSSWREGGLDIASLVEGIPVSTFTAFAPGLAGRFAEGTLIEASTRSILPPVVRAAPPESGADLLVDIGGLVVEVRAADTLLFRFVTHVSMQLDLVPEGDDLIPTLKSTEARAVLVSEPVADANDELIEGLVAARLPDAAMQLLMGSRLQVPTFGGILHALDVQPDPGGRFLTIITRR